MTDRIVEYIRAGFAGIWLVTREEARAEAALKAAADTLGWSLYSWSVTAGLVNTSGGSCEPVTDPVQAAEHLTELPEQSILVLKDYHQFLGDSMQPADPLITRTLKEQLRLARCSARVAVILGCRLQMPPELEKEFTILEGGLPGIEDLEAIAEGIAAAASMLPA